ncbi:hypothetical protein [Teredinibacter haidensis]|uniref:hypothetical protein n=1 Tax=Teredinibacter haidensis TaxID=2731755 RepID=UPI000948DD8B|nr:hypothetical protein [Teredinibacter haidensis]
MRQEDVAILVNEFKQARDFDGVFTAWHKNRAILKGATVVYGFDDIGSQSPLKPISGAIEQGQYHVRSIFSKKNVYYFNEKIMREVFTSDRAVIPSVPIAYLDTQIAKYALRYISDLKQKKPEKRKFINSDLGQSFKNLISDLYDADVMLDFTFFIYENYGNFLAGEEKSIRDQLFALNKFSDANKEYFKEAGDVRYEYSNDTLRERVEGSMSLFSNDTFVQDLEEREYLQTLIACLILKTIQLRYSEISKEEKVIGLVKFCDRTLSGIFYRELIVCTLWLYGESLSFFEPVNRNAKPAKIASIVNGMAWDFILIRNVERGSATKEKAKNYEFIPEGIYPEAEFFCFPMYVSFDRRMVEVNDLFKYKGLIIPDRTVHDKYIPIAEESHDNRLESIIGSELNSEIFSPESSSRREGNRPSLFQAVSLRRRLEYKVVEIFS